MAKKEKNKKENSDLKWFITIFITTFMLSIVFSYISVAGDAASWGSMRAKSAV